MRLPSDPDFGLYLYNMFALEYLIRTFICVENLWQTITFYILMLVAHCQNKSYKMHS